MKNWKKRLPLLAVLLLIIIIIIFSPSIMENYCDYKAKIGAGILQKNIEEIHRRGEIVLGGLSPKLVYTRGRKECIDNFRSYTECFKHITKCISYIK